MQVYSLMILKDDREIGFLKILYLLHEISSSSKEMSTENDSLCDTLSNTLYSHIIQSRESAINKILSSNFPVPYKPLLTVVRQ